MSLSFFGRSRLEMVSAKPAVDAVIQGLTDLGFTHIDGFTVHRANSAESESAAASSIPPFIASTHRRWIHCRATARSNAVAAFFDSNLHRLETRFRALLPPKPPSVPAVHPSAGENTKWSPDTAFTLPSNDPLGTAERTPCSKSAEDNSNAEESISPSSNPSLSRPLVDEPAPPAPEVSTQTESTIRGSTPSRSASRPNGSGNTSHPRCRGREGSSFRQIGIGL